MDSLELPEALAGLRHYLLARGFTVVKTERGDMGYFDLVLEGAVPAAIGNAPTFVEINCDRGHWSATIKFGDMTRWTTTNVWKAFLANQPYVEQSLEEQTSYIRDHMVEMASEYLSNKHLEATLAAIGESYMREKLGLPPKVPPPAQ